MENGHTLHLVARDPTLSQPSSGQSSGETNGNNGSRGNCLSFLCSDIKFLTFLHYLNKWLLCNLTGNDANASGHRARVGQISHSVVLGTFNVGDQAEGIVPDLTRVYLLVFLQ